MSKIDIAEFDFDYTPFCDQVVVRWLIENRRFVESRMEYGQINEDMIITYADLDKLIDSCKLSASEKTTIDLVMQGYTMTDIEDCYGGKRQGYRMFYIRAIRKICETCKQIWSDFHGNRMAKGFCY